MNKLLNKLAVLKKKGAQPFRHQARSYSDETDEAEKAFAYFIERYEAWAETADHHFSLAMGEEYMTEPPKKIPEGKFHFESKEVADQLVEKIRGYLDELDYVPSDYNLTWKWWNTFPGEIQVILQISV